MATTIVEGFSLSHCAILDGTTQAELADIYGVREASLDVDTDSYDNTGDDTIMSTWSWFNFATLTVQAGYVPFGVVALLSGATLTSSGAAPGDYYNLPLWNEGSLNTPTRPVLIRVPSKDSAGLSRTLDIVLYRVQFDPISFDGPSYKDGLILNYSGKALMSSKDEVGATLTEKSIGRLVSRPKLP
jgi:hypothetical protein